MTPVHYNAKWKIEIIWSDRARQVVSRRGGPIKQRLLYPKPVY